MDVVLEKKFNPLLAVIIWIVHLCFAAWLVMRAGSYAFYNWGALLCLIASFPYLAVMRNRFFVLYEPLYLCLGGIVGTTVFSLLVPSNLTKLFTLESLEVAVKIVCVGAPLFMAGYWSGFGGIIARRLPITSFIVSDTMLRRLPVKFYAGWLFLTVIIMSAPTAIPVSLGFIADVLQRLFILVAIAVDAHLYFSPAGTTLEMRRTRMHRSRLFIFLPAQIVASFLAGFSGQMLVPILFVTVVYIKTKKKLSLGLVAAMAIFLFFFFSFIAPFTKSFREVYWEGHPFNYSIDYAVGHMHDPDTLKTQKATMDRAAISLALSARVYDLQQQGEKIVLFNNVFDFFTRFIPRFVWPNKPVPVNYNELGKKLGFVGMNDNNTAVGLTLFSGFLLSGGFWGVVIGMFFVGIVTRTYWQWLIVRTKENFFAFVIFMAIMQPWIMASDDFLVLLHGNIAFLAYVYFLIKFLKRIS